MSWCLGLGRNSWSVGSWRLSRERVLRPAVGEGPPEPLIGSESSTQTRRLTHPRPDPQPGEKGREDHLRGRCVTNSRALGWEAQLDRGAAALHSSASFSTSPAPSRPSAWGAGPPASSGDSHAASFSRQLGCNLSCEDFLCLRNFKAKSTLCST